MEEFFFDATVQNIYFSDLDPVRIIIKKNSIDYCTIPQNPILLGKKEEILDFQLFLLYNFNSLIVYLIWECFN